MEKHKLSMQETERINEAMHLKMRELDRVIDQAGKLVSQFTNYPAFALTAAAFAAAGTTSARLVVGTSYRPDHHQAHGESAQCLQCVFHHHFLWILSLY